MVLAITVMTVPTFESADSSQRKPTIVLVHGAWADGSSWSHIIPILQREDYTVVAPPNPLRGHYQRGGRKCKCQSTGVRRRVRACRRRNPAAVDVCQARLMPRWRWRPEE